jgi:glycogen debranching enzyme
MLDVIEIENQYYVRAKSSLADTRTNVLMAGDTFAVFDRQRNFRTTGSIEQGLFYKESRHLSRWVLRLAQDYFLLLSSNVRADNALLSVDLTNPEMRLGEQGTLRRAVLHVSRSLFVWANSCVRELRSEKYFSGWGVRTIATTEVRYSPMSYHNGSVWPHDNALVAHGLAQSVEKTLAAEILTGLFDASIFLELHRLPELFCGFPKQRFVLMQA